ncbi:unnamed protein product [Phytophthora fragariaefolia]|uniref:Unnamed protein product n=1 Tax=Phytophthora fragariaefolia TaxID=1490495 RepID=A0A9W6Y6M4_9STRA|nr:unnamed protein product [Phytophthora fragariaefolia]
MSKRWNPPDGDMVAQLAEVASLSRPISYPPMKSLDGSRKHLSPKHRLNVISHATHRTMVVASSTNAASGTSSGGGSAAPSVSSASLARKDGHSSSDESEEEEAGWFSSGMLVVIAIPPGEPSDITVRVVGVPATESHNDGRNFLQDGFGGLEALVQMESLGATELAVLYDFFDDNDVIGDFILTPRECDQQFHPSYWIEKLAEVQREWNAAVAQMRSDFDLLMGEREKNISSLRSQVQTLKMELEATRMSRKTTASRSQGPRLRTTHVMNFLQDHATGMMNWPQLRGLLDHLASGTQVPPEWQTVIIVLANDRLAFQAPSFVRIDPPQDEDDEETKESDPPAPDSFLDLSRSTSTTKFGSKSFQLGKRASGSQSPKSHKKPASDGVHELPSERFGSSSPSRPEEVPLPLSPSQARASLADYPVVWKNLRRDVKLLMEDRLEYPAALALVGEAKCLHTSFPLDDLTIMLLSMMHWYRPSLDDGEINLLESEDEAEDKAEKDEDYNPHQDLNDGVDDEDVDPDNASDD